MEKLSLAKFDVFGIKTVAGTDANRKECAKMNVRQGLAMIPVVGIFTGAMQIYDACKHEVHGVDMGSKGARIFRGIGEMVGVGALFALADIFKSIFFPQKVEKSEKAIRIKENTVKILEKYKFSSNVSTPWILTVTNAEGVEKDKNCREYDFKLSDDYKDIESQDQLNNLVEAHKSSSKEDLELVFGKENATDEELFSAWLYYSWLTNLKVALTL